MIKVVLSGKTYYYTPTTATTLTAGCSHNYTLTLKDNSSEMGVTSSSITEWTSKNTTGEAIAENDGIYVETAGTLSQKITDTSVTSLKVTGNLNATDLALLKTMAGSDGSLQSLDLSGAVIEGNELPANCFQDCTMLEDIILPTTLTKIGAYAFLDADCISSIDIPASVTFIGDGAFSVSTATGFNQIHILNSTQVVTFDGTMEDIFGVAWNKWLTVYVPAALLDSYLTTYNLSSTDKIEGE